MITLIRNLLCFLLSTFFIYCTNLENSNFGKKQPANACQPSEKDHKVDNSEVGNRLPKEGKIRKRQGMATAGGAYLGVPYRGGKTFCAKMLSTFISRLNSEYNMSDRLYSPFFGTGAVELASAEHGMKVLAADLSRNMIFLHLYKKYSTEDATKKEQIIKCCLDLFEKYFSKEKEKFKNEKRGIKKGTKRRKNPGEILAPEVIESLLGVKRIYEELKQELALLPTGTILTKELHGNFLSESKIFPKMVVSKILLTLSFSAYNEGSSNDNTRIMRVMEYDREKLWSFFEDNTNQFLAFRYPREIELAVSDYSSFSNLTEGASEASIYFMDPPYMNEKSQRMNSSYHGGGLVDNDCTLGKLFEFIKESFDKNQHNIVLLTYNQVDRISGVLETNANIKFLSFDLSEVVDTNNGKQSQEYLFVIWHENNASVKQKAVFEMFKKSISLEVEDPTFNEGLGNGVETIKSTIGEFRKESHSQKLLLNTRYEVSPKNTERSLYFCVYTKKSKGKNYKYVKFQYEEHKGINLILNFASIKIEELSENRLSVKWKNKEIELKCNTSARRDAIRKNLEKIIEEVKDNNNSNDIMEEEGELINEE